MFLKFSDQTVINEIEMSFSEYLQNKNVDNSPLTNASARQKAIPKFKLYLKTNTNLSFNFKSNIPNKPFNRIDWNLSPYQ